MAQYERPDAGMAWRQLATAVLPLLGLLGVMLFTVQRGYPYGITLAFAVVAAGLLARTFIFLHDASHGSFFASPRANAVLGTLVGLATLTPYGQWRWSHLTHHATFGNLDKRGIGDVQVMTVDEYRAATPRERLVYRVYRHPVAMFVIGPTLLFGVIYRFPIRGAPPAARRAVWLTDLAIVALLAAATLTVGLQAFLLVMAPIWIIAWTAGVWLFYVQHQFQGVYWARQAEWDPLRAALEGSSYYRLPRLLQWFTGNIGLHHVHHLRSRIPNYRLQAAHDATPAARAVTPITIRNSLGTIRLKLYDEATKRMVGFKDAGV